GLRIWARPWRSPMRAVGSVRVVLTTCGSLKETRKIARQVVSKRLAACVSVVRSPVESFYTWKGKLENAREYLLVMKTTAKQLSELEREVKALHGYEVPEFIAVPITEGSRKYLDWLREGAANTRK